MRQIYHPVRVAEDVAMLGVLYSATISSMVRWLFSPYQQQRIRELMDEFGVRIVVISPGLFKYPYPAAQRERFPLRTFDVALYEQ